MSMIARPSRALGGLIAALFWTMLVTSARGADPKDTAQHWLDRSSRQASEALQSQPGYRPALDALGEVLQRGAVDRGLLGRVVANPFAQPYLANTFKALGQVDRLPGIGRVLERMAEGRDDASVRGPSFEIIASAALGSQLRSVSNHIRGHEIDGLLNDGTIVEMKHVRHCRYPRAGAPEQWSVDRPWSGSNASVDNFYHFKRSSTRAYRKARQQLVKRCQGRHPAMLVVPRPAYYNRQMFDAMSNNIGVPLTVVAVNQDTCTSEVVYRSSSTGRRDATDTRLRGGGATACPVFDPAQHTTAAVRQGGGGARFRRPGNGSTDPPQFKRKAWKRRYYGNHRTNR